jgi:hypothetical protein
MVRTTRIHGERSVDMKRVLTIALLATSLPATGLACECDPGHTISDHYDNARYVFRARTQRVRETFVPAHLSGRHWLDSRAGGPPVFVLTVDFELLAKVKGEPNELFAVYMHGPTNSCSVDIEENAEYLFFSDESGAAHRCAGTIARSSDLWGRVLLEVLRKQAVEIVEAEHSEQQSRD